MKTLRHINLLLQTTALAFSFQLFGNESPDLSQILRSMNTSQYNNLVVQLSAESWIIGKEPDRKFFLSLKDRMDLKEELILKLERMNVSERPKIEKCTLGVIRCEIGEKMLLFLKRS
jgi:hypothetical protein